MAALRLAVPQGRAGMSCGSFPTAVDSVAEWLDALNLARYKPALEASGIQVSQLRELDDAMLQAAGVSLGGHRKRMLLAAKELTSPPPTTASSSSTIVMRPVPNGTVVIINRVKCSVSAILRGVAGGASSSAGSHGGGV